MSENSGMAIDSCMHHKPCPSFFKEVLPAPTHLHMPQRRQRRRAHEQRPVHGRPVVGPAVEDGDGDGRPEEELGRQARVPVFLERGGGVGWWVGCCGVGGGRGEGVG